MICLLNKYTINMYTFILFVMLMNISPASLSNTSGGNHNFRVHQDQSDPKRLLCLCKRGSGVSNFYILEKGFCHIITPHNYKYYKVLIISLYLTAIFPNK